MQTLKLIIAGGRDFDDYQAVERGVAMVMSMYTDTNLIILSGMAKGADTCGWTYAKRNDIDLYEYPADWNQYGKRAGFMRNAEMAREANALLVFWDGKSRGTQHMISCMADLGKQTYIVRY